MKCSRGSDHQALRNNLFGLANRRTRYGYIPKVISFECSLDSSGRATCVSAEPRSARREQSRIKKSIVVFFPRRRVAREKKKRNGKTPISYLIVYVV